MMTPLLGVGHSVPCPVHAYVSPSCVPEPRARARPSRGLARTVPVPVCGRLGSSSSFFSLEAALREGAGWCLPALPSAGPLVAEKAAKPVPTSEPPFSRWACVSVFLATPPCTFLGKPWLPIEEAIAVSQTEWGLEPLTRRSDNLGLHSRSELLSQHPWLLKSQ
ncbi:hypothetical protein HJG60_010571 [Phyllostomus discolor]|uniref:Uncharacterized protein n=1 Tax=Phyllostomus discolor TaxID=89673 RepID=A0A834EF73_9CHIR|nr:hypothetical protein HJG60_010571 [Phyllostomus discolor]